jgi:hypothetical protein
MAKSKGRLLSELVESPKNEDYADVNSLPDTGNKVGDQAFVEASNRLYIWNGSGWYNIALINTAPSITSNHDSSYNLSYNTPLNISVAATDPEGLNLNYSYNTSDSIGNVATITNDSSQFTITPSNNYAVEGSFSLAFRASDGVNIATAGTSTFTLANQAPSLSGNSASYILSDDGSTATVITLTSVDPEGQPITYSATGDSGFNSIATVANDSSVFTITPKNETQAPGGGTGTLTFTASDGVKSTNAASSFSLTFTLEWSDGTMSISQQPGQSGYCYMGMECAVDSSGYHGFTGGYNYNHGSYTRAGFAATYDIGYNGSGDLTYCQQDHYFMSGTNNGSPQAEGNFGRSVDMHRSGDFAIVGEPRKTVASTSNAGQALIYRRELSNNDDTFQNTVAGTIYSTWGYNQNDYVGTGVAMSGDARVVAVSTGSNSSAPGRYNLQTGYSRYDGSSLGHQYFTHASYITGPSNRSKFFGCDRQGSNGSIDLDYHGQTLSVGDPGYSNTYGNQGRVHIYTRSGGTTHPTYANNGEYVTWTLQASIVSNSPTEYELFGTRTALSDDGNVLAVGCPFPNTYQWSGTERQEGSIKIFTRSGTTWSYSTTLSANTGVSYGGMGVGLAISKDGTVVVAGAPESAANNDNINDQHGKVYVFRNTGGTWSLEATLTGNSSGINLGYSVALSGNGEIILSGAPYAYSNRGGLFAHQIG